MSKLPAIEGSELVKFLRWLGFKVIRRRGSHIRLASDDGRITTVPVHKGKTLPKGLLRTIIREDMELELQEFLKLYKKFKG
ncbi:type II toxin-antitoxin system HicA family toxin [bacterium]|nr:type II toxin-antitoxin system HicA family toxin [bacterium]